MLDAVSRLALLDELRKLAKKGAALEASVITTFSLNGLFYEEVLLRALERAGSRLNILLVDAKQLAIAFQDPVTRPQRAGRDYLLVPINCSGAFHPKVAVLLSPKLPLIAVGSHNVTESGYARNDEVTVCWGHQSSGVPREILDSSLSFTLDWAREVPGISGLIDEVALRLERVAADAASAPETSATFIGWRPAKPSLLEQIKQYVPGKVSRILVVSPFFDDHLQLLHELEAAWRPTEIVVGIQPQSVMLARPERASGSVRFAEFLPPATSEKQDDHTQPPYLHGKIICFETDQGKVIVVGSANASAPAWLQGELPFQNAEAVVVLYDDLAREAFGALGLDRLAIAPRLSTATMLAVAGRAREQQRLEKVSETPSIRIVSAVSTERGWLLPGLIAETCRSAVLLGQDDHPLAGTKFVAVDGGVELSTGEQRVQSGSLRIDGDTGPIAIAILNNEPQLRRMLRPKEAGRLLDALGRLDDDYDAFGDLFDLFERHVLGAEPVVRLARSPSTKASASDEAGDDEDKTPGPRGISLSSVTAAPGVRRQLNKNDLIADFLAALIRDLAPPNLPEGDPPDIDEEERADRKQKTQVEETPHPAKPGEWERLVTACRKRVSVLIERLRKQMDSAPTEPGAVVSLAGKVLATMCLLQRLRLIQPREGSVLDALAARESLVTAQQLRSTFKNVMRALYCRNGLGEALENNSSLRGSEDRRSLDSVMLWTAREIGVDFDAEAPFNSESQTLLSLHHDRVDGLVAAVSAAAHIEPADVNHEKPVWPWADAPRPKPDWMSRHMALGRAFQKRLIAGGVPTLIRSIAPRDIVVWRSEPNFPRLVASVASNGAVLLEPGGQTGAGVIKVQTHMLSPLDFAQLRA